MDAVTIFSIFVGLIVLPAYVYIICNMAVRGIMNGMASTVIEYLKQMKEIADAEGRNSESKEETRD